MTHLTENRAIEQVLEEIIANGKQALGVTRAEVSRCASLLNQSREQSHRQIR